MCVFIYVSKMDTYNITHNKMLLYKWARICTSIDNKKIIRVTKNLKTCYG